VQLLQKQDVLRHVIEWQAPAFQSAGERVFLLELVLAIIAVARLRRYRSALIVAVFLAASLLGARNISVASIVFVPILAAAWPSVGQLRTTTKGALASAIGMVSLLAIVLVAVVRVGQPGLELDAYPVRSLDYLRREHVDLGLVHMATIDRVGNLVELRDGAGRRVFFDDRYDMFPTSVSDDEITLISGTTSSVDVLSRWSIDLVLWQRHAALTAILEASGRWRTLDDHDRGWVLLCRRGATLSHTLGTC
jgi:hypothetical protein